MRLSSRKQLVASEIKVSKVDLNLDAELSASDEYFSVLSIEEDKANHDKQQ